MDSRQVTRLDFDQKRQQPDSSIIPRRYSKYRMSVNKDDIMSYGIQMYIRTPITFCSGCLGYLLLIVFHRSIRQQHTTNHFTSFFILLRKGVCVPVERYSYRCVTQASRDGLDVHTCHDKKGGMGVSQIVEVKWFVYVTYFLQCIKVVLYITISN